MDRFQLHIDAALTNVSVMYRNAAFVADQIFPEVPVQRQSDKYFKFAKDNLRRVDDAMAARVRTNEVQMSRSADSYSAEGHGVSFAIPDEWRGNDDLGTLEVDATIFTSDAILLNRELNIRDSMIAGMTTVDLSGSRWTTDTVDPINYLDQQKEVVAKKTGMKPNSLLVSRPVLRGLRNNLLVKGRMSGAPTLDASHITIAQLAAVLEVDNLIVGEAVLNANPEGEAESMDYVWGKYAALFYRPTAPGLRTISLGYHYMWNFPISGGGTVSQATGGQAGVGVRMWREEGKRCTMVESLRYYDQKIVCADAGLLFSNVVA